MRLQPLYIRLQLRKSRCGNAIFARHKWETEQDVCGREVFAAEKFAIVWGGGELRLQEFELGLQVLVEEGVFDFGGDGAGYGFDEEGYGTCLEFWQR